MVYFMQLFLAHQGLIILSQVKKMYQDAYHVLLGNTVVVKAFLHTVVLVRQAFSASHILQLQFLRL